MEGGTPVQQTIQRPADHHRLIHEVSRRRTFAIISHPDAGKTTLTEKLLLYSGAVAVAGAVRARKNQGYAASDWMEMERRRGISITSAVLQIDYRGYRLNLLDTPGHQDFSEDTYRTLMAADSAIMVLDAAKGVEPQTIKLFSVCRRRGIPVLTFINKMDHPTRDPLDLLGEIEQVLGMDAAPRNWPIGDGPNFQGVYDRVGNTVLLFQRTEHGRQRAPMQITNLNDPLLPGLIGEEAHRHLQDEIKLLAGAGAAFDQERFLRGEVTPVFFGSALNNFGVDPFLEALLQLAPPPAPRRTTAGEVVSPESEVFSGFVVKIQGNMDPRHRDRIAFLRVCSGRLEKDISVYHPRLNRQIRISRPHRLFGRERETIEEAFPGDVIGVINPGLFAIGDTVCSEGSLQFEPLPRFQPEHFALLRNRNVSRYKQFHKGIAQLEEEGAIQILEWTDPAHREPILAAVGELQFDVIIERLRTEYGVEAAIDRMPYELARWVIGDERDISNANWPAGRCLPLKDRRGNPVVLLASEWYQRWCEEKNPGLRFVELR
ncbi:MAG: peptide chain release factor 3 [Firmicutes bacterium]|nr:peptide chain release factor 3 [Bacillota bacterium]